MGDGRLIPPTPSPLSELGIGNRQPFMRYLNRFNGDFIPVGFEISAGNLRRPRVGQRPCHGGSAGFIKQADSHGNALDRVQLDLVVPIPELIV